VEEGIEDIPETSTTITESRVVRFLLMVTKIDRWNSDQWGGKWRTGKMSSSKTEAIENRFDGWEVLY